MIAFMPPGRLATPAIDAKKRTDAGDDFTQVWRAYEAALRKVWQKAAGRAHAPGSLAWCSPTSQYDPDGAKWDGDHWMRRGLVEPGCTLTCACSRSAAADGRCHRVVAAPFLHAAGWRVVLDGVEFVPKQECP